MNNEEGSLRKGIPRASRIHRHLCEGLSACLGYISPADPALPIICPILKLNDCVSVLADDYEEFRVMTGYLSAVSQCKRPELERATHDLIEKTHYYFTVNSLHPHLRDLPYLGRPLPKIKGSVQEGAFAEARIAHGKVRQHIRPIKENIAATAYNLRIMSRRYPLDAKAFFHASITEYQKAYFGFDEITRFDFAF